MSVSQTYDGSVVLNNPTVPGYTNPTWSQQSSTQQSTGSSAGSSQSSSYQGLEDPELIAQLKAFITEAMTGGSADYKAQRAARTQQIADTRTAAGDYTKQKAFEDAAALMQQNLRQSLEKNMPAINKSIQGAGTSASAMQGLLSQKLATESAQAAGALGAEQAKAYGGITSQLSSVLEALTRTDPTLQTALANAFADAKIARSSSTGSQSSTQQSTGSSFGSGGGGGGVTAYGGGSRVQYRDPNQMFGGGGNRGSSPQEVPQQEPSSIERTPAAGSSSSADPFGGWPEYDWSPTYIGGDGGTEDPYYGDWGYSPDILEQMLA